MLQRGGKGLIQAEGMGRVKRSQRGMGSSQEGVIETPGPEGWELRGLMEASKNWKCRRESLTRMGAGGSDLSFLLPSWCPLGPPVDQTQPESRSNGNSEIQSIKVSLSAQSML